MCRPEYCRGCLEEKAVTLGASAPATVVMESHGQGPCRVYLSKAMPDLLWAHANVQKLVSPV